MFIFKFSSSPAVNWYFREVLIAIYLSNILVQRPPLISRPVLLQQTIKTSKDNLQLQI